MDENAGGGGGRAGRQAGRHMVEAPPRRRMEELPGRQAQRGKRRPVRESFRGKHSPTRELNAAPGPNKC